MEDILVDILYSVSLHYREILMLLVCVTFMITISKDNKRERRNNMRLLKVEYSTSTQKNKKYRIRKYYLDETTGKIHIIDEHTNDKIVNRTNKGN